MWVSAASSQAGLAPYGIATVKGYENEARHALETLATPVRLIRNRIALLHDEEENDI